MYQSAVESVFPGKGFAGGVFRRDADGVALLCKVETDAVLPYILRLRGIVGGDAGSGNYRPGDSIIRAEACVIFTRICAAAKRIGSNQT